MSDPWIALLLPMFLLLGRVSAFVMALPILGHRAVPMAIRVGVALLLTVFLAMILPIPHIAGGGNWMLAVVLMIREVLTGLALGGAINLVFMAVHQAGSIAEREMGFALASIIDPVTGEEAQPMSTTFNVVFSILFLVAGGHQLMIAAIARSYNVFPIASLPSAAAMAMAIVKAGSLMLLFGLKLAAPVLAALLVLSVVLAVLARVVPEMNILLASLPLRIALGVLMAAAILPSFDVFVSEFADWMNRFLIA